jgi:hypothetical protein
LELNQYPFKLNKLLRGSRIKPRPITSNSSSGRLNLSKLRGKFKLPITNSSSGRRNLNKLRGRVKPQFIINSSSSGGGSQWEVNKVKGKIEFIISSSSGGSDDIVLRWIME